MVVTIEIEIHNGIHNNKSALIECSKNTCYMNQKKYYVSNSFINKLLSIICIWKNEYGNDSNINSEEFNITVTSDEGKQTFHGKGIFPSDYQLMKEMLGDLDD